MKTNHENLYLCFICHEYSPEPVGPYSNEETAFQAGWAIKLDHGQAKAICPNCTNLYLGLLAHHTKNIKSSSDGDKVQLK